MKFSVFRSVILILFRFLQNIFYNPEDGKEV